MNPYQHDFFLDIDASLGKSIIDSVGDITDAGKTKNQTNITQTLQQFSEQEFFLNISPGLGIPLPSFKLGTLKFSPDVRGFGELGASFSITQRPQTVPAELAGKLSGAGFPTTANLPYIQIYSQLNLKYGLNFDISYKSNWFGHLFLHKYDRRDIYEVISVSDLATKSDVVDLDDLKKGHSFLASDLSFGYKAQSFKTYFKIEELKISESSGGSTRSLAYELEPLLHYHAQYTWDFFIMNFTLYGGLMKREAYEFYEGFYKGFLMDFKYFPIDANIFIDNEFVTLQPKIDLWLLTMDLSYKQPLNQEIGGFKQKPIYKLDFRISI